MSDLGISREVGTGFPKWVFPLIILLIALFLLGFAVISQTGSPNPDDDPNLRCQSKAVFNPSQSFPQGWRRIFHDVDTIDYAGEWHYLATIGGVEKTVGVVTMLKTGMPASAVAEFGQIGLMPDVWVNPDFRQQGIGEYILRDVTNSHPKGTRFIWSQAVDESKDYTWECFLLDFPLRTFDITGQMTRIEQLNFPESQIKWFTN